MDKEDFPDAVHDDGDSTPEKEVGTTKQPEKEKPQVAADEAGKAD